MGQLTRAQIVSEGLLAAGDSRLTSRANVWLNAWLRSQYAAFPWPFLLREKAGITLSSGSNSFQIGAGEGGVTAEIRRIVDPINLYTAAKSTRTQIRIRSAVETELHSDPDLNDPTNHRGLPTEARVYADATTWGKWTVQFDKWADQTYLVKLKYYEQPADLTSDSAKPLYPNDRTLMKAVETEALRYKKDPSWQNELNVLAAMVVDDRLKFGEVPGQNDWMILDPNVYR